MRHHNLASLLKAALGAGVVIALAAPHAFAQVQPADRYGGQAFYPNPAAAPAPSPPTRVLSWPGKTLPAPPQPAAPQSAAPQPAAPADYSAAQHAPYLARPAAYPSPYQPQAYYAPAPAAAQPTPGSSATAPPQMAYPFAIPPQMTQPLVGPPAPPQPPASIYAPPPQAPQAPAAPLASSPAAPDSPEQAAARRMAAAMPPPRPGARLYSVHRQFGMEPDPIAPAAPRSAELQGQPVELAASFKLDPGPDPASQDAADEALAAQAREITRTALLRGKAAR